MFGKVLIVDDSEKNLEDLTATLIEEYYDVVPCMPTEDAIHLIDEDRPDLIIVDTTVAGEKGFELCSQVKNNPETFYIPVIIITSKADDEVKAQALNMGADDIIVRPIDNTALFARVNSLLRLKMMAEQWIIRETALQDQTILPDHLDMYFGKKCRYSHVMVVGSEDKKIKKLVAPLEEKKYKVIYTKSLQDAESYSDYKKIDLFIVDLDIGHEEALRFSSKLKGAEKNKNTPVLIVGDEKDSDVFVKALEIGCNDYIVYPFNDHEYLARVYTQLKKNKYQQQLEKNYQKSLSLASVDDLTGVSNRRYLYSYLNNMFKEMKVKDQKLAILMMDIDHFKDINDTYGHLIGDEVLIEFSKRLQEQFRDFDLIARYGGDEFIAVIPYVGEMLAVEISGRVRESISDTPFTISVKPHKIDVKISVGLSITDDFDRTSEEVIDEADKSLYEAKRTGRNKLCIAGQSCEK